MGFEIFVKKGYLCLIFKFINIHTVLNKIQLIYKLTWLDKLVNTYDVVDWNTIDHKVKFLFIKLGNRYDAV